MSVYIPILIKTGHRGTFDSVWLDYCGTYGGTLFSSIKNDIALIAQYLLRQSGRIVFGLTICRRNDTTIKDDDGNIVVNSDVDDHMKLWGYRPVTGMHRDIKYGLMLTLMKVYEYVGDA